MASEADSRFEQSSSKQGASVQARREARRRRIQANASERLARLRGVKHAVEERTETNGQGPQNTDEHSSSRQSCGHGAAAVIDGPSPLSCPAVRSSEKGNELEKEHLDLMKSGLSFETASAHEGCGSCPILLTVALAAFVALSKMGLFGEELIVQNVLSPVALEGLLIGIYYLHVSTNLLVPTILRTAHLLSHVFFLYIFTFLVTVGFTQQMT